ERGQRRRRPRARQRRGRRGRDGRGRRRAPRLDDVPAGGGDRARPGDRLQARRAPPGGRRGGRAGHDGRRGQGGRSGLVEAGGSRRRGGAAPPQLGGRPLVVPLQGRHDLRDARGAAGGVRPGRQPPRTRRRRPRGRPGADDEGARVDLGGPALLLVRRDGLRLGLRVAGLRPGGRRAVGARGARRGARGPHALPAPARHGPGAPRALLQHAAHLQAAVADVDRGLVPDGVRRAVRGLGGRRPAALAAHRQGPRRGERHRGRLPRLVHRRAAGRHRGARLGAVAAVPRPDLRGHRH
ncbi:MAG: Formate dehydrogenase O putative subunit, partial [uncultured Solirubrobacteraceae bacterium]